jgi:hypothetical protein
MVRFLSDRSAIDFVVGFMGSYKTDINRSYIKKYQSDDPVMIAPDIENKTVIAYRVNRIEHGFDLMIICPISLRNQPVPIIECILCISMLLKKVP